MVYAVPLRLSGICMSKARFFERLNFDIWVCLLLMQQLLQPAIAASIASVASTKAQMLATMFIDNPDTVAAANAKLHKRLR